MQTVGNCRWQLEKQRPRSAGFEEADDVVAEKLAQELLCITNKLRDYGAVDEALLQWSYASFLASLALSTANPRVQGYIAKISGICFHS
jgi:phage gp16-like protein